MKLGAEPKKIAILGGLLAVAVVVYFMNSSSSSDSGYTPPRTAPAAATAPPPTRGQQVQGTTAQNRRERTLMEFRPSLKPKRPEDRPDPMSIDPTLKLELLARLQEQADIQGSRRSIFEYGMTPKPPAEVAKAAEAAKPKVPSPIVPVEAAKPVAPPKPQAHPIPLKFYGYISPSGQPDKRAFFMEGEEIHVVDEGDLVKRRYKIVRIGVNSAVVEDTQFGSQETLQLEEQQPT